MLPCANFGSTPWHRCGCTDDTPCRLGDAGSMAFLPWFVPGTEPPLQLCEIGPDRGHLPTESCSDVHFHVCRCPGMRTAAAVVWEAAVKISLLVLALSLLDRGCCSSAHCSSTGCYSSSTRRWWPTGSHPTESLVEQDCVSSGYWLCVSWAESSCPTESRREKTTKN